MASIPSHGRVPPGRTSPSMSSCDEKLDSAAFLFFHRRSKQPTERPETRQTINDLSSWKHSEAGYYIRTDPWQAMPQIRSNRRKMDQKATQRAIPGHRSTSFLVPDTPRVPFHSNKGLVPYQPTQGPWAPCRQRPRIEETFNRDACNTVHRY